MASPSASREVDRKELWSCIQRSSDSLYSYIWRTMTLLIQHQSRSNISIHLSHNRSLSLHRIADHSFSRMPDDLGPSTHNSLCPPSMQIRLRSHGSSHPRLSQRMPLPDLIGLTWAPSGLLSFPPEDETMYGLFVSGCTHVFLKPIISSQNYCTSEIEVSDLGYSELVPLSSRLLSEKL